MSSIVRQTNKQTGITYVYSQESYRVPGVGPRNRRRLLGKIDPETGELVPTGKQGPKRKHELPLDDSDEAAAADMKFRLLQATQRIQQLEAEVESLKSEKQHLLTMVQTVSKVIEPALSGNI